MLVGSSVIAAERRRREAEFAKVHAVAHLAENGQLIVENVDREQVCVCLCVCGVCICI
jgi:hypothetical protein